MPNHQAIKMSLLFKCLLGALTVLLIALLSKTKSYYIAGLAPLFPTFAIIAHYIIGSERSAADLKSTALFGIFSLVPYFIYLITIYLLCTRLSLGYTIISSTAAWIVAAVALILIWKQFPNLGT